MIAAAVLTSPTRKQGVSLIPCLRVGLVKRDRRRTARKAILSGFAALLIAHAGLALAVETKKPEWRDPEFFHRVQQVAALTQRDTRPLVVILGGSRPQTGLDPEEFGDAVLAYNCSQSGCLPVGERLNFIRLMDAGVTPRFVLIEVLPPVLADPGPMDERFPPVRLSRNDLEQLRPYQVDPARVEREWMKQRLNSWQSLRVPLLANWGLAEAFPTRNDPHALWSAMSPRGWSPAEPKKWDDAQRQHRTRVAHRTYSWLLNDFAIQPVNDRAYRDLLAECRERGIHAALFVMPESPTFRSWYPPDVRERVNDYLQGLSREFGVPLFDASNWIDDEESFLDGHHLLRPAASAFSERFGRECVQPWVRAKCE